MHGVREFYGASLLEAGLSPHFEVLDECNSKDLREKAHKALIHDILHHPDASLAQAHRRLSPAFQPSETGLSFVLGFAEGFEPYNMVYPTGF